MTTLDHGYIVGNYASSKNENKFLMMLLKFMKAKSLEQFLEPTNMNFLVVGHNP